MDEIWNKDLFDDEELKKHSPDYTPQDIYLRMQLRRESVRNNIPTN